jgi:TIR domain
VAQALISAIDRPTRRVGTVSQVFVSYRREDSAANARSIRDRLARELGDRNVFMDVDDLVAGQRFDEVLQKSLDRCDAVLVIIGPRWLQTLREKDRAGATDYVRIEVASALSRGILVIPVLVEHASLPAPLDLPEEIRSLVLHQKLDVSHETFGADIRRLLDAIDRHRGLRQGLVSRRAMWPAAVVLASGAAGLGLWWLPLRRIGEQTPASQPAPVQVALVTSTQGTTRYDIRESLAWPEVGTRRFVRIVSLLSTPTPLDAAEIPSLGSFELLADRENEGDIIGKGTSTIYETLYSIARAQKLSRENLRSLLVAFGTQVDFKRRVRMGEKLDVLFETERTDGFDLRPTYQHG